MLASEYSSPRGAPDTIAAARMAMVIIRENTDIETCVTVSLNIIAPLAL